MKNNYLLKFNILINNYLLIIKLYCLTKKNKIIINIMFAIYFIKNYKRIWSRGYCWWSPKKIYDKKLKFAIISKEYLNKAVVLKKEKKMQ